jgi:hypothetical protein
MADQPLNSNYNYGPLTTHLLGLPEDSRRVFKVQTFAANVQSRLPYVFSKRGISVTVLQAGIQGDILQLVVTATRSGQQLMVDNPLLYKNPPLMAPDGTTYIDATGTHPRMAENVLEALKEIVTQTVEQQNPLS